MRIKNQNEKAIEKLTQFLDKMPYHIEGHYQIARAYQNLEKFPKAKQHYKQVIKQYQKTDNFHWSVSWSYVRLGQICNAMGQQKEAKTYYTKVLSLPNIMGSHSEAQKYLEGKK